MDPIILDNLRAFAEGMDGGTLATRFRDRRFTLRVLTDGFEYTPERTGTPRLHRWRWAERVLARFNEGHSFHPADYKDISANASYLLAVVGVYLDAMPAASPQ